MPGPLNSRLLLTPRSGVACSIRKLKFAAVKLGKEKSRLNPHASQQVTSQRQIKRLSTPRYSNSEVWTNGVWYSLLAFEARIHNLFFVAQQPQQLELNTGLQAPMKFDQKSLIEM